MYLLQKNFYYSVTFATILNDHVSHLEAQKNQEATDKTRALNWKISYKSHSMVHKCRGGIVLPNLLSQSHDYTKSHIVSFCPDPVLQRLTTQLSLIQ